MINKEIGGYFGLEQFEGNAMYSDLVAVNSARNAVAHLIAAKGIKKIYLPYYLCNSIAQVCKREGCAYEYYNIGSDFRPIFDKNLGCNEYLYVVNYFGQLEDEEILNLQQKHNRIICDNVQAFFAPPLDGVDTVYSCRKFFGVPDGGYLSTDAPPVDALEREASAERMSHILGRYESCNAALYYDDFKANDAKFEEICLRRMSLITENILRAVDYNKVKAIREENFSVLDRALCHLNKLKPKLPRGPYAYPFYCENGLEARKKLAKQNIYIATLWPEVKSTGPALERDLAENILPLPCDQRYGREDMERICNEILNLIN